MCNKVNIFNIYYDTKHDHEFFHYCLIEIISGKF
jgi:hypothetical protein